MALIKCKECGGDISTGAAACPKCGKPFVKTAQQITSAGCLVIVVIGVAILALSQFGGDNTQPPVTQNAPSANTSVQPPAAPPTAPDNRSDIQKWNEFAASMKTLGKELVAADSELENDIDSATRQDSADGMRSAFETYGATAEHIDGESTRLAYPIFQTDADGDVGEQVADAQEAMSDSISAREQISKNVDKIEPGNFASAMAFEESLAANKAAIAVADAKEARAMAAAARLAKRTFKTAP